MGIEDHLTFCKVIAYAVLDSLEIGTDLEDINGRRWGTVSSKFEQDNVNYMVIKIVRNDPVYFCNLAQNIPYNHIWFDYYS